MAALCIALGKPDLGKQCRLYKRFGGVQTAVVSLTEADARRLLGFGKLRVGWVNCRIREHVEVARCFGCHGYAICRASARFQEIGAPEFEGWKGSFYSSTSGDGRKPRTF